MIVSKPSKPVVITGFLIHDRKRSGPRLNVRLKIVSGFRPKMTENQPLLGDAHLARPVGFLVI